MIPDLLDEIERYRQLAERQCLECETVTPVRIENLQKQIASLRELLRQADSLIETFPRHYNSATETDAVAYMIQRDCWQAFQERCWTVRAAIRSRLTGAQKCGF
jgi:Mg2+ and Co2+ transporter CorA